MTRLLVKNAVLLTCDPDRPPSFRGWFTVGDDGRLAAVEAGDPGAEVTADLTADQVLDVDGALVGPGFVSSHSHLFTSASRGLAADQSLYGWIEGMTRYTNAGDAEDVYWFTRHGAQDFVRNGITTAFDFTDPNLSFERESAGVATFTAALPDTGYQHAQLRASLDAGLRSVHSVMLGQGAVPRADALAQLDDVVAMAESFSGDPRYLRMAISGSVQWAPTPDMADLELAGMRAHGLLNQPHLLETPHEIELQRSKFDWYSDAGVLGPDVVFGHFIQTDEEIIATSAAAGCAVSWQPMSNGRLASGVTSIPEIRAAGMRVGIGLDDQSCTDVSDPFSNMRTGIALLRATYKDPAAMPVHDMLVLATRGSAEVLGVDDRVGSLRVGRYADFLVVDPRDPDTGPVWDAVATYVLACSLRNLHAVYSGGVLVADGARLVDPQSAEVVSQTHERMARLAAAVDTA